MGKPSNDLTSFKSQVLSSIDIVEMIGRSVTLKRGGKDFVGLCPFHQEKTPSFYVSPTKQYFNCYGCKANGNAIDFVMKRDHMEFIDALRLLGESLGLELPRRGGGGKQKAGERQLLYEMQSAAGAFFSRLLEEPQQGLAAREYLAKRGFNGESIKKFQIGYSADSWDALLNSAVGRKYLPEQLALGGLLKKREKGSGFYDTFRNRLMFPIRDDSGRVIAFGGREMPGSESPPKYLNSPETPLFAKSRCLFGLDLAKQKIVESRTVVVVEGYTDVVMAHQFGASNVVSPLGTALTEQHISLLRRFADRIVLLFDADTAGDTAVDKAVGLFLTQEIDIAVASMPDGVDPDEYFLVNGAEAFEKLIAAASDALEYKWKRLLRKYNANGNSLTGQQKTVEEYLGLLAAARGSGPVDTLRWGQALGQVSKLTGIPVEDLNRRFKATKPARQRGMVAPVSGENHGRAAHATVNATVSDGSSEYPAQAESSDQPIAPDPVLPIRRQLSAHEVAERRLLGVLLSEPNRWPDVQKHVSLNDFGDEMHHKLAELYWGHQQDEGEPVFNEFLGSLSDENLRELAIIAVQDADVLADLDGLVNEAIGFFAESRRRAEGQKLLSEVQRNNSEPGDELLKKLQEQAREPNLRRI
ncbi:MAG TPA: DNA primase [Tepidisphaeraceae bacterium]|jgi:DNA primase|nr:DNA primase [Tepidisphaeraceae bacterium]